MPSLHHAATVARQDPPIEHLGAVDACPECCVNVEPPKSVTPLTDGYRAAYLCSDCGHAWATDWRE